MCIRTIWRGALSLHAYSTPRALVLSGAKKSSAVCISNVVQFDRNSVILISFCSLSALLPSHGGLQRYTHTQRRTPTTLWFLSAPSRTLNRWRSAGRKGGGFFMIPVCVYSCRKNSLFPSLSLIITFSNCSPIIHLKIFAILLIPSKMSLPNQTSPSD